MFNFQNFFTRFLGWDPSIITCPWTNFANFLGELIVAQRFAWTCKAKPGQTLAINALKICAILGTKV